MEDKKIVVRHEDQSGLYKMISDIFKTLTYSQRECLTQMSSIRHQGKEIYETSKKEFLKSQRARTFFGLQNTSDALQEANDYALSQMKTFLNGFKQQEENIINAMIQIAKESPEQFLNAIKGALTETANNQLKEPGEEIGQYGFEEILNRMKAR